MTIDVLQSFLGWCAILNIVLLTIWFLMFWLTRDWIYRFHSHLFQLSKEQFNGIHYAGMMTYKLCIYMLNILPYLALHFMR